MPLHYIVFHPERYREPASVRGLALVKGVPEAWEGTVWVDKPNGSEDPYVFNDVWLYSFCKASRLRRKLVDSGSYIFFCNGDATELGLVQSDTVFVVDHAAAWPAKGLPEEFAGAFEDSDSALWVRHFRAGFDGSHPGKYTFVSRQWQVDRRCFAFLPLNQDGERASCKLSELSSVLSNKIEARLFRKRSVPLEEADKEELLEALLTETATQVIEVETRREVEKDRITRACTRRPGSRLSAGELTSVSCERKT